MAITPIISGGGSSFDVAQNLFIGGGGTSVTGDVGGDAGTDNIAIGAGSIDNGSADTALAALTNGVGNIAIGGSALKACTTGTYNISIGDASTLALTTGGNNIALGDYAFPHLTTGNYNLGIGEGIFPILTTGEHNTGIGRGAGAGLTTGSESVFIGHSASASKDTITNGIAIGSNAQVVNDNQCVLGGTGGNAVCLIWAGATAPEDDNLASSQGSLYWDFTNGAAKLNIKAKTANSTVVTTSIPLSVPAAPQTSRVNADLTNATNTFSAITGMSANLLAGHKYTGRLVIKCNNSTSAEGIKFDFNGGDATMTSFWAVGEELAGGTTVLGTVIATSLSGAITFTTITGETLIEIPFSLVCDAAGTLIPRFAEGTAHTLGTATVELGSYMTLQDTP